MARSITTIALAAVFTVLLIASSSPHVVDAITCGQVATSVAQCVPYARSGVGSPPPSCCSGVKTLNSITKTSADRQAVCNCLKTLANSISGYKPAVVAAIPGKCGVKVPFPISTSTDCTKL